MFAHLRTFSPHSLRSLWLTGCLLAMPLPLQAASQQELQGVKTEISRQAQALSSQEKKLNQLQSSLKSQELDIVKIEKAIRDSQAAQKKTEQLVAQLAEQIQHLAQDKQRQTEQLEALVQSYYMIKRANPNGPFLQQDVDSERISHYFQHLAQKRSELIEDLAETTQNLQDSRAQREHELEQIDALLAEQKAKKTALTKAQSERKSTLSTIKRSIQTDQSYLAELKRNETRLKAEIAKAAKRNAIPMDGLARQKGKLPWPLKGAILHRFGSAQTANVAWKGMVISASYGQKVKAVYPGTVVFAEYLRGYGLVVLLDHGRGDMTLYGYNQALLKKEGDKVVAGEEIALAGDTGGQDRASLYFEIRRNSHAQNPTQWLAR